jgi:glycosyltransferase involved in cell wall biosynthesis
VRLGVSLLCFRPGRIGGAETYVRELVRHLPRAAPGDEWVALVHREAGDALETPGFERAVIEASDAAVVARRILEAFTPWRDRALERRLAGLGLDAALFPQQSIYPKCAPVPAVLTAVDVQHLEHPERFGLFDRLFRPAIYPYSLRRARRVIAISEFTRRALLERAGAAPDRVVTIPLGFDPAAGAGARPLERMPGPYLYYPAATYAHKGHAILFRSYATLARRGAVAEPLVLSGQRTGRWRALARLVRELGMEGRIIHLGLLPAGEVPCAYAGAAAVLFPSEYEGFGLPVLEAAARGKKVVTSRLAVFDEIGVPARFQIDFADPGALLAALRLPGPTALERRPWSWEECAAATAAELRRAAAEGAG